MVDYVRFMVDVVNAFKQFTGSEAKDQAFISVIDECNREMESILEEFKDVAIFRKASYRDLLKSDFFNEMPLQFKKLLGRLTFNLLDTYAILLLDVENSKIIEAIKGDGRTTHAVRINNFIIEYSTEGDYFVVSPALDSGVLHTTAYMVAIAILRSTRGFSEHFKLEEFTTVASALLGMSTLYGNLIDIYNCAKETVKAVDSAREALSVLKKSKIPHVKTELKFIYETAKRIKAEEKGLETPIPLFKLEHLWDTLRFFYKVAKIFALYSEAVRAVSRALSLHLLSRISFFDSVEFTIDKGSKLVTISIGLNPHRLGDTIIRVWNVNPSITFYRITPSKIYQEDELLTNFFWICTTDSPKLDMVKILKSIASI